MSTATAVLAAVLLVPSQPVAEETDLRQEALAAMAKAAAFMTSISTHGGYAGIYSLDLKRRYGEARYERAGDKQIWVQPPGTPSVGEAYLRAWRATGDEEYLDAARAAGRALAWGQLACGGWDHLADVSGLKETSERPSRRKGRGTFDDRITQGALDFLMELGQVVKEPWLSESVELGLGYVLKAQFENGAWPQAHPLRRGYTSFYTFNDNVINDCISTMLKAHRLYGRKECLDAARRGGDFMLLSQGKPPQAAWAQQYSHDLKPAKARRFEPAGYCSAVTARNIRTLVELCLYTRDDKYLRAIPPAVEWLERSTIGENLWSRLYEVGSNRPIYGDRDGKVHYDYAELSEERKKGYAWQRRFGIPEAIAHYRKVKRMGVKRFLAERARPPALERRKTRAEALSPKVREAVAALDSQGRWTTGETIRIGTFVTNLNLLCEYLELTGSEKPAAP